MEMCYGYTLRCEAVLEVPGPPLFPVVIDRQLNPREAKGNNIEMHLITLFFVLQAFLPHVWHVSEITLHV